MYKLVACCASVAALVVITAGPAHAYGEAAIITGDNASDGWLLGSVEKSGGGFCSAITQADASIIINGLVDCNADGQNVAALIGFFHGVQMPWRYCEGYYFGGWSPAGGCSPVFYSDPA